MEQRRELPAEIEAALREIAGGPPEQAARTLALAMHRAAAGLHGLANREAKSRKGTPEWGQWARLTNAARAAVLQASTCRDAVKELAERAAE